MIEFRIPFFQHDLGEEEIQAVREVLLGPILTTGDTVEQFEKSFASLMHAKHAVGVTSCTGALHLSLLALGIGPGDEVITTPLTFIATATAILQAGATPVFVDVDPTTGVLDPEQIEKAITPKTKAILPVHLYGLMCEMKELRTLANRFDLKVIEDSAHCIEGEREGIRPGQLGDTACFSFYATKNLTCGEGGAVVTNSDYLAEQLKLLRLHGMTSNLKDRHQYGYKHWDMVTMGWKYNMDNIQAALLLPQLKRLKNNFKKRIDLASYYREKLNPITGLTLFPIPENTVHACHLFPIRVNALKRDQVIQGLINSGIGAVVNYRAIHLLSYFRQSLSYQPGDFPHAERIGNEVLSLPFYPTMPREHVSMIAEVLKSLL